MIGVGMVAEIRRLLAEGRLSQRKIAKLTGISRATIGAIANGRRPDYQPRPANDLFDRPQGPPRRCTGCGGLVYLPCKLCRVRAWKSAEERKRRPSRPAAPRGDRSFVSGAITSPRQPHPGPA